MVRGRDGGVGYDGDKAAGKGLDAGNGLAFGIGSMDIEIRHVDEMAKLLLVAESEQAGILEIFSGKLLVFLHQWPLSAQDELNPVVIAAAADGLNKKVLSLFARIAADHHDEILVLELRVLFDSLRHKRRRDAV